MLAHQVASTEPLKRIQIERLNSRGDLGVPLCRLAASNRKHARESAAGARRALSRGTLQKNHVKSLATAAELHNIAAQAAQEHQNTMKKNSKNSAFSLSRLFACLLCILSFLLALLGISGSLGTKSLAQGASNSSAASVQVGASYHNDVSPALRDMPASTEADLRRGGDRDANENPKIPYRHVDS